MPVKFENVLIFSIQDGEGKNGYFANIVLLNMEQKGKLEIFTKDKMTVNRLKEREGEVVSLTMMLEQSKFGIRLDNITDIA